MAIEEVGCHRSFSGVGFFVTKCVRRGGPQADFVVYITNMQGSPHNLIDDDHREIRDLVARAIQGGLPDQRRSGRLCHAEDLSRQPDRPRPPQSHAAGRVWTFALPEPRSQSNLPIIMLTAMGEEVEHVIGLEMGR